MSALTDPSRVPIHSLMRGTSFWTTATTETSGGGGGGGSFRLQAVEEPNATTRRARETVFMGTPGRGDTDLAIIYFAGSMPTGRRPAGGSARSPRLEASLRHRAALAHAYCG